MPTLRLGTRGSQLALFQATTTAALLKTHAGIDCEIVVIKTSGDRLADAVLSEIGGKRLFVKEIEDSLLAGEIDLAVHSSKDLPAVLPAGLTIGAVLATRGPARCRRAAGRSSGVDAAGSQMQHWDAPRASAPAACGASHSSRGCFPGAGFSPFAAISIRGCASSTRATMMRWSWPRPACVV